MARESEAGVHRSRSGAEFADSLDCRRTHQRQPQPTIGTKGLLRREVVRIGLADIHRQTARTRGGIDQDQGLVGALRTPHGNHHAGRRLVVGPRNDVGVVVAHRFRGVARRVQIRRSARRGTARPAVTVANFWVNSPYTRCRARRRTSPQAAASQKAVAPPLPSSTSYPSGSAKRSAQTVANLSHQILDRRLAVRRSHQIVPGANRANASGRTLVGPLPKRPSAGLRWAGMCKVVSVTVTTRVLQSVTLGWRRGNLPGAPPSPCDGSRWGRTSPLSTTRQAPRTPASRAGRDLGRREAIRQAGGPVRQAPDHRAGQELVPMSGS